MTRSKTSPFVRIAALVLAGSSLAVGGCSETPDSAEVTKAKAAAERAEDAAARAEQAAKLSGGSSSKPAQQVAVYEEPADSADGEDTAAVPANVDQDAGVPEVGMGGSVPSAGSRNE